MAKYGVIERKIAKILEKFPEIKQIIKKGYQTINYIFYKKKNDFYLNENCLLNSYDNNSGNFWGYYDKSPVNGNNVIYNGFSSLKKYNVRSLDSQDIILNGKKISQTTTWNWQQGSMLTWLDKDKIIHNFFQDNEYKSKIIDINTKEERVINYPIYSVGNDGKFSISLSFSRLAKLRPDYGYFNKSYENIKEIDFNDGIYYVDLVKNESNLIISFEDLLKFNPRKEMENAWHKVNHIEISPNGERFIFHHRWFDDSGRKWSRLISANILGEDLYLLSDDNMVSHCIWKNNIEIAGWMRKKIGGDKYYLLQDKTEKYEIIGDGILAEDGHPSFSKDGEWMLTDTYPNKSRMSSLLLYNMKNKGIIKLGEFFSSFEYYGETRCDLHPRFNLDGKGITFDSVHTGVRQLYEIDITNILEDKN